MALVAEVLVNALFHAFVSLIHRDKLLEKTQIWSQNKSIASTTTVTI